MSRAERIAIVTPRFSEGGTVGGAETLLNQLAGRAAADGRRVTLLTTCARDHFSWKNEWPAGRTRAGALDVIRFAVDERDAAAYHKLDAAMARGETLSADDEQTWIRNSVNCSSLYTHLREHGGEYDRILAGPYLFGVVYSAALIHPDKTLLVPCLHDEPFARLGIMKPLFEKARGCLFNTEPERDFAKSLFRIPDARCRVVGMGIASFDADPGAFARRPGIYGPYVVYSGRREGGKGTPLLCDYMNAFRERTRRDVKLVFTGSGPIEAPTDLLPHITDLGFVSVHPSFRSRKPRHRAARSLDGAHARARSRPEPRPALAVRTEQRRVVVPELPRVRGRVADADGPARPARRARPQRSRVRAARVLLDCRRATPFRRAG